MSSSSNRRFKIIGGIAAITLVAGTGGAVAGSTIGSRGIKDNSIQSRDVRDGTLRQVDLGRGLNRTLKNAATVQQLRQVVIALDGRLKALEAEDASGANTNFTTLPGTTIVDANTVRLTEAVGDTDPNGTAAQIENLDVPVQAGQTVSFTYKLEDGAQYVAGAPRVYYEIAGEFLNTFNGAPEDKGVDNGDGTFTKTVDITQNGRVGAFGVVYDSNIPGTVTVTDVKVGNYTVKFK